MNNFLKELGAFIACGSIMFLCGMLVASGWIV